MILIDKVKKEKSYSKLENKEVVSFNDSISQKIAIFSIYVTREEQISYHERIYKWLKDNNYLVVLVHPIFEGSNNLIRDFKFKESCDILIKRNNFGYDFGSYAAGLIYIIEKGYFSSISNILFINDSIIGPFGDASKINDNAEFWANTDSHQLKYHYQSYLFGFKLTNKSRSALLSFFFDRGDIYTNDKTKVIKNFELSMYDYFSKKNLECNVCYPKDELAIKFKNRIFDNLRTPKILRKTKYYLDVLIREVNPTHHLWLELFESGFKFIKKELVRDNPTNYPCLYEKVEYELDKIGCVIEYKEIIKNIK
ncbi:hypothetical protein [Vibrio rhizosphaerae]|uniref:hypothetical protein n=1 Tax=Vibrio rhizosphaerae TaxID=398736 RepID=UPI00056EB2F8|nr:hypothetical protein [Vibrio rhizosphaerae]